jgi:uncharacterized delta-60 repeat protein
MTEGTEGGRRGRYITRMRGLAALSRRGWGLGLAVAILLGLSWTNLGHGAPGDLDPTFGTEGIAITFGPSDIARAVVVQPDGKVVVAGTSLNQSGSIGFILLVRYLSDGRGDTTFGAGGKVTVPVGNSSSAYALILQPDGKVVVAGGASLGTPLESDLLLARFQPDGRLDASFGTGGIVTTDFGAYEGANGLLLQPDGTLMVTGTFGTPGSGAPFLVRYQADGRLDTTFGSGGKVTDFLPAGNYTSFTSATSGMVRQPDGPLVVAACCKSSSPGLGVARLLPDGQLDSTFGVGGQVALGGGGSPHLSLVLQPDGKLVVASARVLTRLLPDGQLDSTFGSEGTVTTSFDGALVLQPDGKLVLAGAEVRVPLTSPPLSDLLLTRIQPDGRLDATFGLGGTVMTTVQGSLEGPTLLQQSEGKLVVASIRAGAVATRFTTRDILLARYQALGCPATDPEPCLAQLEAFVTDVYQAALVRQPDTSEVAYWVDVLTTGPTPNTVRGMLHVVFESPEFRQRPVNPWQYVEALYQAMLGREPDQAELDWWVQAVLDRFNTLLPAFLDSPEFQRLVPDCQDLGAVTLLVGRLYQQVLRRVPNWEEIVWWTDDIITWCALEEAVEFFFNTLDYLSEPRTLADHVTVLYGALLAREPDAGERALWVDDLAGQLVTIESDVMASPEFETHVYSLFP